MATSLSKLVDNLTEDIHGDKCVDCKSDLSYMKVTDEALIFRCFNCKKNYKKEINKELIERFASTYKFCNNDLNKFVMLLRKGVYPYEYMDGWDKFNETSIPNKESFYSNLTMENISETDYRHANNEFKTFKLDNLGDYHDLYVRSDTLLLADVFENLRKACIKTYELDPVHFISLPGLAWQGHATLHSDMPLHSDIPFLPERIKIDKTQQLVCNLRDKKKYVVHISISKQALDHGLKLKKVYRVIEFNQEAWLKKYIDMNIELRKKASNDFEKDFFKLMHNAVFGKMMENVRKHRDIKLVKTDHKRNKLVSEPNYHTMKLISEYLLIIEMKKVKVKMKKPIYLGLSILEIGKIIMYEFWYDYVKNKYRNMAKLRYMDTDSLIMNIKTKDFYKDIAQDVEERFDTSNYNVDRPLPKGKNKKVIGLMKDELGGGIITEFVALRPKTYSYMTDEFIEMKKAKGTKKCIIKKMLKFEDYKKCLFDNEPMLKSQQRFKSENHEVYMENINKIALSSNDGKKIVALDGITSYPCEYCGED